MGARWSKFESKVSSKVEENVYSMRGEYVGRNENGCFISNRKTDG